MIMKKIVSILAATFILAAIATVPAFAASLTISLQNLSTGQSIMACPIYAVGPCNTAYTFLDSQVAGVPLEMFAEGAVAPLLVSWFQSKGWSVMLGSGEIYVKDIQTVTITLPPLAAGQFMCVAIIGKLR